MRHLLILFLLWGQYSKGNTTIYGTASGAKNAYVYVSLVEDYLTNTETLIYNTVVNSEGRFVIELEDLGIRKIVIRIQNSYSKLYIQNGATYFVEFPGENIDIIPYFSGSETEILFFNLDSTDINYKILGFEAWMDDEIASLYILKDVEPVKFVEGVLQFKTEIQATYAADTSNYFKNYIKYSLGKNLDNIQYFGAPTRKSKYEFFIKNEPLQYHNPAYMDYVNDFYDGYLFQLDQMIRKPLIQSVYSSNAAHMITAIEFDSLIPNHKFAEFIALKIIQQEYYSGNLPKNNLIDLTNQIRLNSPYSNNQKIATNLIQEFYTITTGDQLPIIYLNEQYQLKAKHQRYLYIHFFDPNNPNSLSEISALKRLQIKYNNEIEFVTIYLNQNALMNDFSKRVLDNITWKSFSINYGHSLWKSLNVGSFPYYILVNPNQTIIGLPALGPNPNGSYETIEKTFYDIKKGKY
tara:strand:- start:991 stop:2382 length:1392 start_codon:yes stop_codon:yes gene_type:complete